MLTAEEPLRRLSHHELSLLLFAEITANLTDLPGNPSSPTRPPRPSTATRFVGGATWGRRSDPPYVDPFSCSLERRLERLRCFGGPAHRCYDEWPDRWPEIMIVLGAGIGPYPHTDPFYTPWQCGVCFEYLGTEWWICPMCNRERRQLTDDALREDPIAYPLGRFADAYYASNDPWMCGRCGHQQAGELTICLWCGAGRAEVPYPRYVASYGYDPAARDPGLG